MLRGALIALPLIGGLQCTLGDVAIVIEQLLETLVLGVTLAAATLDARASATAAR
jgi:hypothetical protein